MPFSRAILLDPENTKCTLVNGLSYPKLPESRDTTATVVLRKDGIGYVGVSLEKHPWRMLSSILSLQKADSSGGAIALSNLQYLKQNKIEIWTGGLAADKGKILDIAEWIFNVEPSQLESLKQNIYDCGVELAESGSVSLSFAVKEYFIVLKCDNKFINNLTTKAKTFYWSILNTQYNKLIECTSSRNCKLNKFWYPLVRDAMDEAYTRTCPHDTPRQIQAFARGLEKLRLKKINES